MIWRWGGSGYSAATARRSEVVWTQDRLAVVPCPVGRQRGFDELLGRIASLFVPTEPRQRSQLLLPRWWCPAASGVLDDRRVCRRGAAGRDAELLSWQCATPARCAMACAITSWIPRTVHRFAMYWCCTRGLRCPSEKPSSRLPPPAAVRWAPRHCCFGLRSTVPGR
jgi:hypothetical protein